MTDPKDGFELLRTTNPVDETDVDGPDSPRALELLATVIASRGPEERNWVLASRNLRLVIALGVVMVVTTAAALLWTRIVDRPQSILCYEAIDLDADIAAAPAGGDLAAEACVPVWDERILENPDLPPIPPLTACVSESGALAVFPTQDATICDVLGLAFPEPSGQETADSLRSLEEGLIAYFESTDCPTISQAEIEVRRILDQSRFGHWTIEVQPESADRPCASHSFDPQFETIHLIPIPLLVD